MGLLLELRELRLGAISCLRTLSQITQRVNDGVGIQLEISDIGWLGKVAGHTCNSSTWAAEVEGLSRGQSQLGLSWQDSISVYEDDEGGCLFFLT